MQGQHLSVEVQEGSGSMLQICFLLSYKSVILASLLVLLLKHKWYSLLSVSNVNILKFINEN